MCSDGRCVNTEGSFQCECRSGFTSNPEKNACLGRYGHKQTHLHTLLPEAHLFFCFSSSASSSDVDECVSSSGSVCGSQRCENTIGSYRCLVSCEPGHQVSVDGRCVGESEPPSVTAEHDSSQTDSKVVCVCVFSDEDECASQPGVCGSAQCENVKGSFMCKCVRAEEIFNSTSRQCVRPVKPGKH